jgi:hypothetical protein
VCNLVDELTTGTYFFSNHSNSQCSVYILKKINNSYKIMEEFKPSITMSSTPGLLTLPAQRFDSIVAQEPLASHYVVENQPFAR